jgi:hypothetical protein
MKSGNLCAFEACRRPLAIEVEQSGRTSIVSQEAHIVAEKPDGPRGESALTLEERNSYPNLVLVCCASSITKSWMTTQKRSLSMCFWQ